MLARLAGPNDGGGDEESPSAARATWTGSRLGESLDGMGRFCVKFGSGWDECEESGRLFRLSTAVAS